jgi:hypothetical protein
MSEAALPQRVGFEPLDGLYRTAVCRGSEAAPSTHRMYYLSYRDARGHALCEFERQLQR